MKRLDREDESQQESHSTSNSEITSSDTIQKNQASTTSNTLQEFEPQPKQAKLNDDQQSATQQTQNNAEASSSLAQSSSSQNESESEGCSSESESDSQSEQSEVTADGLSIFISTLVTEDFTKAIQTFGSKSLDPNDGLRIGQPSAITEDLNLIKFFLGSNSQTKGNITDRILSQQKAFAEKKESLAFLELERVAAVNRFIFRQAEKSPTFLILAYRFLQAQINENKIKPGLINLIVTMIHSASTLDAKDSDGNSILTLCKSDLDKSPVIGRLYDLLLKKRKSLNPHEAFEEKQNFTKVKGLIWGCGQSFYNGCTFGYCSHSRLHPEEYFMTIDLNKKMQPSLVGNIDALLQDASFLEKHHQQFDFIAIEFFAFDDGKGLKELASLLSPEGIISIGFPSNSEEARAFIQTAKNAGLNFGVVYFIPGLGRSSSHGPAYGEIILKKTAGRFELKNSPWMRTALVPTLARMYFGLRRNEITQKAWEKIIPADFSIDFLPMNEDLLLPANLKVSPGFEDVAEALSSSER